MFEHDARTELSSGVEVAATDLLQTFDELMQLDLEVTTAMDCEDVCLVEAWSNRDNNRLGLFAQRGGSALVSLLRVFGVSLAVPKAPSSP
jgi:hypothetical protein